MEPAGGSPLQIFQLSLSPHRSESRMLRWLGDAEGMCFFSSGADAVCVVRSLWRNGRARWTSNPEVVGSSPTVSLHFCLFISFLFVPTAPFQTIVRWMKRLDEIVSMTMENGHL